MKRLSGFIIGIVIAAVLLLYGIKMKEFAEVQTNASFLCLSCIGIE